MKFRKEEIIGNDEMVNKVIDSYETDKWFEDADGNLFMVLLDDEDDSFLVFITDIDLGDFDLITSSTYVSLSSKIVNNIVYSITDLA